MKVFFEQYFLAAIMAVNANDVSATVRTNPKPRPYSEVILPSMNCNPIWILDCEVATFAGKTDSKLIYEIDKVGKMNCA